MSETIKQQFKEACALGDVVQAGIWLEQISDEWCSSPGAAQVLGDAIRRGDQALVGLLLSRGFRVSYSYANEWWVAVGWYASAEMALALLRGYPDFVRAIGGKGLIMGLHRASRETAMAILGEGPAVLRVVLGARPDAATLALLAGLGVQPGEFRTAAGPDYVASCPVVDELIPFYSARELLQIKTLTPATARYFLENGVSLREIMERFHDARFTVPILAALGDPPLSDEQLRQIDDAPTLEWAVARGFGSEAMFRVGFIERVCFCSPRVSEMLSVVAPLLSPDQRRRVGIYMVERNRLNAWFTQTLLQLRRDVEDA